MSWATTCTKVQQYIVKIETPIGSGTGFFFAYSGNRAVIAIATALHVVQDAHDWRRPIKIRRVADNQESFLPYEDRAIVIDYKRDSAAILIRADAIKSAPKEMLGLTDSNKYKQPGTQLMWGGYPGIAGDTLCFFGGRVSAFIESDDSYYLDGVAINGVSGGPVFDEDIKDLPVKICGIVSAYFVNRQRGETLPGFAMAHDATHLNATVETFKNLEEARKKEEEERKKHGGETGKPPTADPAPEPKPRAK
jgi:hypothetical protein